MNYIAWIGLFDVYLMVGNFYFCKCCHLFSGWQILIGQNKFVLNGIFSKYIDEKLCFKFCNSSDDLSINLLKFVILALDNCLANLCIFLMV